MGPQFLPAWEMLDPKEFQCQWLGMRARKPGTPNLAVLEIGGGDPQIIAVSVIWDGDPP